MSHEKIRLLSFVNDFNIGGTEKHVLHLLKSLDTSRFDLHVACFKRRGALLGSVEALGFPLSDYNIKSLWKFTTVRRQLQLADYIRRNRIDIVNTYGFYTNVFGIPACRMAARRPVVVSSIRDTGVYLTEKQKLVQKLVCRLADHILVNADAVKSWLIASGYPEGKVTVIRNGIAVSDLPPEGTAEAVRREFRIPLDAPVVAVHSRLNRAKGIDYLLEAAPAILKQYPATRFMLIGGDGLNVYTSVLEEQVARLGLGASVIFTGFRLDIAAMLSAVDISVLPSLSEGLSNSLLESMAAGKPVIATRVGGNPEIVDDGVTGILIPSRDPDAIARAVCTLLADSSRGREMGKAGRQRILRQFSMERLAQQTEDFYLSFVKEARSERFRISRESTV